MGLFSKIYQIIRIQLLQIYCPSLTSVVALFIFSILILVHSHISSKFLSSTTDSYYQNLIAIFAGISSLIFALIIFIAQQFNKDYNEARVLLKKSFLYPM